MPSNYKIRKIKNTEKNKAIVFELDHICFIPSDGYLKDDDFYGSTWWILYFNNTPVGFAGIKQSSSPYSNLGYLCRVGILKDHRGHGLQKQLIKVRLAYAKKVGWQWVRTDTADNPASSNNLIDCGFKLYNPKKPWGLKKSLYWIKEI